MNRVKAVLASLPLSAVGDSPWTVACIIASLLLVEVQFVAVKSC